jgi:hypothetical protein
MAGRLARFPPHRSQPSPIIADHRGPTSATTHSSKHPLLYRTKIERVLEIASAEMKVREFAEKALSP